MSQPKMTGTMERTSNMAVEAAQAEEKGPAKSIGHFETGIKTCGQLAQGMSLLMADLLTERVSTSVANSVCNGAGKMLKAVEMQQRFGKTVKGSGEKELNLIS